MKEMKAGIGQMAFPGLDQAPIDSPAIFVPHEYQVPYKPYRVNKGTPRYTGAPGGLYYRSIEPAPVTMETTQILPTKSTNSGITSVQVEVLNPPEYRGDRFYIKINRY